MFGIHWILWRRPSPSPSLSLGTPRNGGDTSVTVVTSNYQFHTRLFETNRFRKFVSDLWIDRGLKPILGSGPTQNRHRTPSRPPRLRTGHGQVRHGHGNGNRTSFRNNSTTLDRCKREYRPAIPARKEDYGWCVECVIGKQKSRWAGGGR